MLGIMITVILSGVVATAVITLDYFNIRVYIYVFIYIYIYMYIYYIICKYIFNCLYILKFRI